MSTGLIRITNRRTEALIVPSTLPYWRSRGWDVVDHAQDVAPAVPVPRHDSAETLESDAPVTAPTEE